MKKGSSMKPIFSNLLVQRDKNDSDFDILKNQTIIKNEKIASKETDKRRLNNVNRKIITQIPREIMNSPSFHYIHLRREDEKHKYNKTLVSLQLKPFQTVFIKEDRRELLEFRNVFDSFDEKEMILDEEPFILIGIHSWFKQFWEFLMLLTIIYSTFFTPYTLCFEIELIGYELTDVVIEVLLILDIFLSFLMQVEDEKENILSSSKMISFTYLSSWFFLDLITCFPATLLSVYFSRIKILTYFRWFSLVRLLKIIKYPYLMNNKFHYNEKVDRLLKHILFFIIYVNLLSCYFIFIGLSSEEKNWVSEANLDKHDNFSIYLSSIYYHCLIFSTIGFSGIKPVNFYEKIYTNVLLIITIIIFPILLNSISKIFEVNHHKISINNKMKLLNKFTTKYNINKSLKKQIAKELQVNELKNYKYRNFFFDNLPNNIQHQLFSYINKKIISKLSFFNEQSCDFINQAFPLLHQNKFERGLILYFQGLLVEEMYLVISGSLSLNLGAEFENLEVAVIRPSHYFGDIFLITDKVSPFELKVKSKITETFSINQKNYKKLRDRFPMNILKIIEKSTQYLESVNSRKKHLINLLENEKSKERVLRSIKLVNSYLFERDFDDYFFNNKEMEGINEFLVHTKFRNLKGVIENFERTKKFASQTNSESCKNQFRNKLVNMGMIPSSVSHQGPLNFFKSKYQTFGEYENNLYHKYSEQLKNTKISLKKNKTKQTVFYGNEHNLFNFDNPRLIEELNEETDEEERRKRRKKRIKLRKQRLENKIRDLLRKINILNSEQSNDHSILKRRKDALNKISVIIKKNKNKHVIMEDVISKNDGRSHSKIDTLHTTQNQSMIYNKSTFNNDLLCVINESNFDIINSPPLKKKRNSGSNFKRKSDVFSNLDKKIFKKQRNSEAFQLNVKKHSPFNFNPGRLVSIKEEIDQRQSITKEELILSPGITEEAENTIVFGERRKINEIQLHLKLDCIFGRLQNKFTIC